MASAPRLWMPHLTQESQLPGILYSKLGGLVRRGSANRPHRCHSGQLLDVGIKAVAHYGHQLVVDLTTMIDQVLTQQMAHPYPRSFQSATSANLVCPTGHAQLAEACCLSLGAAARLSMRAGAFGRYVLWWCTCRVSRNVLLHVGPMWKPQLCVAQQHWPQKTGSMTW